MVQESIASTTGRGALRRAEVTEQIKGYILRNNLGPGDALPTETTLCAELGASRSSVREAIKTLSALDIVDVRHGHGTYVGRLSLAALVEGLTFRAKLSSQDDFAVLNELVGVRQLLEQGLAGAIIDAFDDRMNQSLSRLVAEMDSCAERGEPFVEQDRAFHLLLMEPLRNQIVSQLTAAFWDVQAIVAPLLEAPPTDVRATVAAHAAIVRAAADGSVTQFVQAIDAHYAPVRRELRAKIQPHA